MGVFRLRARRKAGIESVLVDWPYAFYPRHVRLSYEITAVVSGVVRVDGPAGHSILSAGDAVVFHPFEPHGFAIEETDTRFLSILFGDEVSPPGGSWDNRTITQNLGIASPLKELRLSDVRESAIDSAVFACISAATERLAQLRPAARNSSAIASWLENSWRKVVSEDLNPAPIRDLAKQQGVTPQHMTHAFTSRFGISPRQLEIAKRVEMSRIALHTKRTLAEISTNHGFSDQSHHARVFRKFHLVTPGEYRRGMETPLKIMDIWRPQT